MNNKEKCLEYYAKLLKKYNQKSPSKELDLCFDVEVLNDEEINHYISLAIKRMKIKKDVSYYEELLYILIKSKAIPIELLSEIPQDASSSGKSRFDQIYDAVLEIHFPEYSNRLLSEFQSEPLNTKLKIWRAMFPRQYKISSIFLRAESFQEAFALSCDYLCRLSLRLFKQIPRDMTIRVAYVSESALKAHYKIKQAVNKKRRSVRNTRTRGFTNKQMNGARTAGLGVKPGEKDFSIIKYGEYRDNYLLKRAGVHKQSVVEHEFWRK